MHDPDFNKDLESFVDRVRLRAVELTARQQANREQVTAARARLIELQKEMQELHAQIIELGSERVGLAREAEKTVEFNNTCVSFLQKRRLSELQEESCKRRQPALSAKLEKHGLSVRTAFATTAVSLEVCKRVADFLAANNFPIVVLQNAYTILFGFLHPQDDGTPCNFAFTPCDEEGCQCKSKDEYPDFPSHLPLTFIWD